MIDLDGQCNLTTWFVGGCKHRDLDVYYGEGIDSEDEERRHSDEEDVDEQDKDQASMDGKGKDHVQEDNSTKTMLGGWKRQPSESVRQVRRFSKCFYR